MKRSTKIILSAVAVLAAAVCVVCCLLIFQYFRGSRLNSELALLTTEGELIQLVPTMPTQLPEEEDGEEEKTNSPDWYIHVNFDALSEINEDIYAWIDIPGTPVSYAVVQHPSNDLFYNNHAVDKSYYTGGSIFSQRYNAKDFQDPMTVLYGHNRQSDTMFAPLNGFAAADVFEQHPDVYVYTRDAVYHYRIFAAFPHSSEHLLLNHDFSSEKQFNSFFAGITSGVDTNLRTDLFPEAGDRVLTLSTCYRNNRMQRYLVQAVLEMEYAIIRD